MHNLLTPASTVAATGPTSSLSVVPVLSFMCPQLQGNTQGPMAVTVSGAMQAPFFFKGVTTEEEWRASLRSSPVPWAELGSDK